MKSSQGKKARISWLGFLVFLAGGIQGDAALPVAATGADVDESRVQKTFFVDPAHTEAADDDKHGAADLPFATLSYACQIAAKTKDANVGVKIVLAPGMYREEAEIRPPSANVEDSDAPLVIEAAEREQAVIDGADTEGWSPSTWKVEDARWTHPWPFRRGAVARSTGLPASATGESYRRGDLVLINGTALRQVNAAADLAPGCFYVSGVPPVSNPGGRRRAVVGANPGPLAVVAPPPDTELPGAIIQVGTRARGLTIIGRRNVVVRGLLIQHAAQPDGAGEGTAGLVIDRCANVLVEDVLSQWNDGAGLKIAGRGGALVSKDFTLRRVRLLHNGCSGLEVSAVNNLLAEDSEASFNNFRGEWAGWFDPAGPAGVKIEGGGGSTWRRQHVIGNACRGLWLNGGNSDVTVEDAVVRDNVVTGVCIENDPGPVLLRHCLVAGTKNHLAGREDALPSAAGLSLVSTPGVTLESNVFADNATTQLEVGEMAGKSPLRVERHVYLHNVFYNADGDASLCRMPVSESEAKPGSASYYATLDSQENCFWNPVKAEGIDGYFHRAASRKQAAAVIARPLKLEEWQAVARQEAGSGDGAKIEVGSLWQDPLFADPLEGDYRLKRASPVADWNLPADDSATGQ